MYYCTITVNSPNGEYEYKVTHENDLSALMRRIAEVHPTWSSVVLTVLKNTDAIIQI